ncbi:uncharacterized protein [Cherax quadricarinatus]|uniref:uncharacterized protein n=1 Tax=Cherax quadricarinatus TaxID=27406 RepID=UPI00387E51D8
MPFRQYMFVLLSTLMISGTTADELGDSVKVLSVDVAAIVSEIMDQHLASCHLVLITATLQSLAISNIIRRLSEGTKDSVLVDAGSLYYQDQVVQSRLLQGLWGDSKITCRGLILDLSGNNYTQFILSWKPSRR